MKKQQTDLALFLQYSYTVAVLCGGQITAINLRPREYKNYGVLVIKVEDTSVVVAINHIYPFIAFASLPKSSSDCDLDFIDCEPLAKAYRSFNHYQVLSTAQVEATPTTDMYKVLSAAELKAIRYWQPRTVGQIIFNWWN